jgi:hypothetical protein
MRRGTLQIQELLAPSVRVVVPCDDRLGFVPKPVRSVQPIQMGSDRVWRDRQMSCNFLVSHPLGRKAQDLTLPLCDTKDPRHFPFGRRSSASNSPNVSVNSELA